MRYLEDSKFGCLWVVFKAFRSLFHGSFNIRSGWHAQHGAHAPRAALVHRGRPLLGRLQQSPGRAGDLHRRLGRGVASLLGRLGAADVAPGGAHWRPGAAAGGAAGPRAGAQRHGLRRHRLGAALGAEGGAEGWEKEGFSRIFEAFRPFSSISPGFPGDSGAPGLRCSTRAARGRGAIPPWRSCSSERRTSKLGRAKAARRTA